MIKKQKQRKAVKWKKAPGKFDSFGGGLYSDQGRSRLFEENKLLLLALKVGLKRRIQSEEQNIPWRNIEEEVCEDFRVAREYIIDLRRGLLMMGMFLFLEVGKGDY